MAGGTLARRSVVQGGHPGGRCRLAPPLPGRGLLRRHRAASTQPPPPPPPSSTLLSYKQLRAARFSEIEALPEYRASTLLQTFLEEKRTGTWRELTPNRTTIRPLTPPPGGYVHEMTPFQIRLTLDAMLATFCLHVESRIAALLGHGYYTIGPCGEEALASVAHTLQNPSDSVALHYRHLGINIARQLLHMTDYTPMGSSSSSPMSSSHLAQVLLDRARGYAVSRLDPVTGGVHCSLGSARSSDENHSLGGDFLVTSTLASQCPPAVGRALGYAMAPPYLKPDRRHSRPVSFVTVGDGSVHNHHFWSAFHLARHARHKHIKCPVVFGISDNGWSISYETHGYVDTLFDRDPLVHLSVANGNDMMDVYSQTTQAVAHSRTQSGPSVVLYKNLIRRFGHAASDRQRAYLPDDQIQSMANSDVLESSLVQAVEVFSAVTYQELVSRYEELQRMTLAAFELASQEPKVDRCDMLRRVAAPLVSVPRLPSAMLTTTPHTTNDTSSSPTTEKKDVMRKLMTRVYAESMAADDTVVYIGEDVRHGGYYVVTEGLVDKFPGRVLDFPPDESSLLGAALGLSQSGLLPIVEIPYAKYLDCGADMFHEIAILYWLSGGSRRNGMIVRLQGFDRGLFGGAFHTSNALPHVPPGVDVVCFSNGEDYVRGFRHALLQAKGGRVVVLVDSTHLLNLRHLFPKDRAWERTYPPNDDFGRMGFDEVRRFGTKGRIAIVTYGNGVVTALQARGHLIESGDVARECDLDIIDCPCVSRLGIAGCNLTYGDIAHSLFVRFAVKSRTRRSESVGGAVHWRRVCRCMQRRSGIKHPVKHGSLSPQ